MERKSLKNPDLEKKILGVRSQIVGMRDKLNNRKENA